MIWLALAWVAAEPIELFADPTFSRGFTALAPTPGRRVAEGLLRPPEAAGEPAWDLAQWTSRLSLSGAEAQRRADGALVWANAAKQVIVGGRDGDLSLRVNGGFEWNGHVRERGEDWPHLLVSQSFGDDLWLPRLAALRLRLHARLVECQRHEMAGYTPNLHAAHYQMFITVQNRNPESAGHGDFYWFGIPIYDDRHRHPRAFEAPDVGHGKFIFTPAGETFCAESAHDGNWITIDLDLLPLLRAGLERAWEKGFLQDSHDPADYRLGGMNLGWEVPGTFDVELAVRGLSLTATFAGL